MKDEERDENGRGQHAADEHYVLPESSSLIILLTLFFCITIVSLGAILAGSREEAGEDAVASVAYGPADVVGVHFDEPLLPELEQALEGDTAFPVPPPPFSDEDIYPCSECHADLEINTEPRELEYFHEEIHLDHGPADRWCFDCHNPDDRDRLRLINGTLIGFDESYRLCGQCHGTIFRDWRHGIHGRRRGFWNGAKSYLLCAHCHNPHAPHFAAIEPLPPPVQPRFLRQQTRKEAP